ncbi:hypothetical protein Pla52o_16450 [Novipirellula galeiformis]|uniref:Uncharacterized protein n=1 Tax=Novipirellula galeiformis TaxID=2528004 RepID=A0A5C6CPD6_9BACT|nr:hypothetical protein Pla52o_16450 [Novipirellula galeiformis]
MGSTSSDTFCLSLNLLVAEHTRFSYAADTTGSFVVESLPRGRIQTIGDDLRRYRKGGRNALPCASERHRYLSKRKVIEYGAIPYQSRSKIETIGYKRFYGSRALLRPRVLLRPHVLLRPRWRCRGAGDRRRIFSRELADTFRDFKVRARGRCDISAPLIKLVKVH